MMTVHVVCTFEDRKTMNSKLAIAIGNKIHSARNARNETQEEFAAAVRITRGYLSDLERGQRDVSLSTLLNICKHTKKTLNWFTAH